MRFLVAFDDTDGGRAALAAAAKLAKASGGELVVLHSLNPLVDAADVQAPTTRDAIEQVAAETRQVIEARIAALDVQADIRVESLAHGQDTADHIVAVVRELGADVVAIGSRRAGGIVGALLGSVTREVVSHSPVPVLVVRPDHD